ncbi:t-cell surface glycoprotein cd8 alpha chain [Limosa lapponica baueri]|uniref:T-cell surface glycoprotein cd8 alpha chain n=1 Tax=Limosa lapponica baueri TaxID=1758121 RepID=A0A2I0URK0_LIMLA|nr:t-cell surface glycoprotein cd8 alpha chain [Limosa lapponica baueri]
MARSPVLLLLALGFCCSGVWGQRSDMTVRFRDRSTTHPQVGQRLELECLTPKEDSGAFWIRQDKDGSLHFIVFISSLSRTTFNGNKKTSTHFEASKDSKFYRLVVKSFTPQDEGNYFCLMNSNQVLYFSPGQPAFLPGQQHLHPTPLSSAKMPSTSHPCLFSSITSPINPVFPACLPKASCDQPTGPPARGSLLAGSSRVTTTVAPTTPAPTNQHGITKKDPCPRTLDTETSKENSLFCNTFIWVPLSGACLLLLLALAVTIILCQKTRRRRCRCKRPANGKPNAKAITPSRHV